ncbi:MAG: arylesterase [Thiomicrospira sp.]
MHLVQLQNTWRVNRLIHRFTLVVWLLAWLLLVLQSSGVYAQAQARLLVMGDSLSAAYGLPVEQGWVTLLQQKLDAQKKETAPSVMVINASLSGETTSGGRQRLPGLLTQHQPKFVIIELGANDALRGQDLRTTERNLADMIAMSQQQGAKVMLLGIRLPTNYGPAYDARLGQMYRDLAARYQVALDPFFLEEIALAPDLMQDDGLHPNRAAQPLIMQRLWPQIQNLIANE